MDRLTQYLSEIRWIPCRNDSGEEVPARAMMRPTGIEETDAGPVVIVAKPNADDALGYCINSPDAIPQGDANNPGYGLCTFDFPAYVLHDAADGNPSFGQAWGSANGSWKIRKHTTGTHTALGSVNGRGYFAGPPSAGTVDVEVITDLCDTPGLSEDNAFTGAQTFSGAVGGSGFQQSANYMETLLGF
jgi:hypothetical protein